MKNGRRFKSGDLRLWSPAAEDDKGEAAEARAVRRCFKLKELGGIVSGGGLRSLPLLFTILREALPSGAVDCCYSQELMPQTWSPRIRRIGEGRFQRVAGIIPVVSQVKEQVESHTSGQEKRSLASLTMAGLLEPVDTIDFAQTSSKAANHIDHTDHSLNVMTIRL